MYFGSTLSNAYATGVVSGANSVGGLVGTLTYGGSIRNAYATATVTGTGDYTGGLLGYSSNGTLSNVYATGAVSGTSKVGGLVGLSGYSGTISNAYATGAVSGTSQVGGLAGSNSNSTISDAYWDLTTSGQTNAVGLGDGSGASGLSTAELAASLPSGFDGAVWSTSDNQSTPWLLANSSFGRVSGSVILGSDSSATPQQYDVIASATQLQSINTTGLSGDYVLGNDLDLASIANFAPIGGGSNQFTGQFDGLGHTISNLTIDRPTTRGVGLFGYTQNATVSNLGVVGGSVTGDNTIGALVGFSLNSTISNAYATAAVSGSNVVGGLVGSSNHSTISNAYAAGAVTGTGSNTGGLVAYSSNSTISNAYATGAVSVAYGFAGGLVGWINNGTINNAYATGAVSGTNYVGGLVGNSANSTINSAYATGAVLGTKANTGGLVGSNSHGTISHAYWDLTTSGLTDGVGSGDGSGVSGLSTAQMHQKASFAGFDFSDTPDWVIYEGHTAPLLAAFLTTLSVSASASHVTYDGSVAGASSVTTTVTGTAPAGALFGNSGTLNNAATPFGDARNVGTYDADLWSDQQGYRITQTAAKLSIDPRSLTGSIAAGRSTYGDALAPGAVSFTNVVSGDDVSGTVSVDTTGHLSTSGHLNAGSYIGGEIVSALSGADAGNYTIGSITGDYTVTQRALTVAFTGTPTRAYDGTLVAHLVPGDFSVSGLVLGEQMQVTQTRGEYASAEVGTHIAVSADLTSGDFRGIGGTDLANYSLPVPVTTNGFGEIRQRVSTGGPGSPLQNTHVNRLSGLPVAGVLNVPNGVIPPAMPSLEIQNGGVEGADDNAS
ncbi:GLUG motif-containing protein [uncultured Thioclava sp.]|uniref:beta strand repeat-containing protein n=1 Tax=uncultured Thioclava sp. TaxID=473858 RepID=UPI0025D74479|nr:GLUG motif-containing protein [uncultured Thioclava sp.]